MPFTPIGSIGDIIALTLLVKDLLTALNDNDGSRGASAQYRRCHGTLWTLHRVLEEVAVLCCAGGGGRDGDEEDTVEFNALLETMRHVSRQVRRSIEPVLDTVRKFGPSLRCNDDDDDDGGGGGGVGGAVSGSGRKGLRQAAKKVQWRLHHSDELAKLQTEVDVYCSFLSVLLSMAHV